jgi:hypothetical protein
MDVLVLIDKLDDLVHNAKRPADGPGARGQGEIYDILDQMRATIPGDQAGAGSSERQEMLAEAKRGQADQGRASARRS